MGAKIVMTTPPAEVDTVFGCSHRPGNAKVDQGELRDIS